LVRKSLIDGGEFREEHAIGCHTIEHELMKGHANAIFLVPQPEQNGSQQGTTLKIKWAAGILSG